MTLDRRTLIGAGGALAALPAAASGRALPGAAIGAGQARGASFPRGFLWGAATSGHQIEGNDTNSDFWHVENVTPTFFAEPVGDAVNSFALWPRDLDLVKSLGLNCYRFGIEWSRIEPEPGKFSIAMLDHYRRILEGFRARGLQSMVTFSHWTAPRWFAARGGFTAPDAVQLFGRFCERAARHLAAHMDWAVTLNEPNPLVASFEPPRPERARQAIAATMAAAAKAAGSDRFVIANIGVTDMAAFNRTMLEAHRVARAAIKAARPSLPVGVTLAMPDDQPATANSLRDRYRQEAYVPWLELARGDDFLGVQNYDRQLWNDRGKLDPPKGDTRANDTIGYNASGGIIYPDSLANSVRYAYSVAKVPIFVTEHGVNSADDTLRAQLIPAALAELKKAMDEGIPVRGYLHWSLLDNYEWISGYKHQYGLIAVDRTTFARTPKPSAYVLGGIARRNALPRT